MSDYCETVFYDEHLDQALSHVCYDHFEPGLHQVVAFDLPTDQHRSQAIDVAHVRMARYLKALDIEMFGGMQVRAGSKGRRLVLRSVGDDCVQYYVLMRIEEPYSAAEMELAVYAAEHEHLNPGELAASGYIDAPRYFLTNVSWEGTELDFDLSHNFLAEGN